MRQLLNARDQVYIPALATLMPPTKRTRTQAELDAQHPLAVDEDLFGVGGHAPPTGAWQGAALGVARLVLARHYDYSRRRSAHDSGDGHAGRAQTL